MKQEPLVTRLENLTDLGSCSYIGDQSDLSKIENSVLEKSVSETSEAMREHMREIRRKKTVQLELADEIQEHNA